MELVEVEGVSERWERRKAHVTVDREEKEEKEEEEEGEGQEEEKEDVTSFFTKIITFWLLVCPEYTSGDRFLSTRLVRFLFLFP